MWQTTHVSESLVCSLLDERKKLALAFCEELQTLQLPAWNFTILMLKVKTTEKVRTFSSWEEVVAGVFISTWHKHTLESTSHTGEYLGNWLPS